MRKQPVVSPVDDAPPLVEVPDVTAAPAPDAQPRVETSTSAPGGPPPVDDAPDGYQGPYMLKPETRAGYVAAFQKLGTKAVWPAAWLANDHRLVTVMQGEPGTALADDFVAMGEVFGWFRNADDPRWAAAAAFVMTAGGVFAFAKTLPPEPPMRAAPKASKDAAAASTSTPSPDTQGGDGAGV